MKAALIVAHPGHELRVYGWLHDAKPLVFVLTDGSGRSQHSRLHSTETILLSANAPAGSIFGRMTDAQLYAALLARDTTFFVDLASELAAAISADGIDQVVGDSIEGYNPSHDVCRLIINSAVELVGGKIENWDFPLVAPPEQWASEAVFRLDLSQPVLERKIAAARAYLEMAAEIEETLRSLGESAFRSEVFRSAPETHGTDGLPDAKPFYEIHGERRVASAAYGTVIRRDHVLAIAEALWNHAQRHGAKAVCASS